MYKIALWSRQHIRLVKTLFIVLVISLWVLALELAGGFQAMGWANTALLVTLFLVGIGGFIITRVLEKGRKKGLGTFGSIKSFYQAKLLLFANGICLFVVLTAAISFFVPNSMGTINAGGAKLEQQVATKTLPLPEKKLSRKEIKELLDAHPDLKKEYRKNGLNIFFVIFGAVVILLLLAALSCSLACNDQAVLAILIGGLGLTGLVWGTIVLLKKLFRKRREIEDRLQAAGGTKS